MPRFIRGIQAIQRKASGGLVWNPRINWGMISVPPFVFDFPDVLLGLGTV